jgi:ubiquinone/menaquinone biosynthesis C-methylase UbiE
MHVSICEKYEHATHRDYLVGCCLKENHSFRSRCLTKQCYSGEIVMQLSQATDRLCRESEVFEELLSLDGKDILELGCGKAELTRLIANAGSGRRVTAAEVDEIQYDRNLLIDDLPNVSFIKAGSESIPLDDESVDIVFMFKSLHHVPLNKLDQALQETKRVLRPGGLAYVSEPIFSGDCNDVLRLFHDEEAVRAAAFNALKQFIDKGEMILVDELFFNTPMHFENFADYEHRVINVTHSNHQLSPELYERVKAQFMLNMGDSGASFQVPIRVDLLQKSG